MAPFAQLPSQFRQCFPDTLAALYSCHLPQFLLSQAQWCFETKYHAVRVLSCLLCRGGASVCAILRRICERRVPAFRLMSDPWEKVCFGVVYRLIDRVVVVASFYLFSVLALHKRNGHRQTE